MSEPKNEQCIYIFVDRLTKLDAGSKARLKRSAGKPLEETNTNLGLFYSLLQHLEVPASHETKYWLVATLYPHCDAGSAGTFGDALRRARSAQYRKGLDRRVEALLDSDAPQLAYRLGQTIRFLHAQRVAVNWQSLLADIIQWDHPNRFVQKRWAKAYFSVATDQLEPRTSQDSNSEENE